MVAADVFVAMAPGFNARAILFDLFGTLVHFDLSRLPVLELPQGAVRSTIPSYAKLLAEMAPGVEPATFLEALVAVSVEIARERRESHREVPSRRRFERALLRLGVGREDVRKNAERLSLAHMEELTAAAVTPPAHRPLLERLGKKVALGCISNFDHAPSAHRVLERANLAPLLEVVVISDSFGMCKPSPAIFAEGLRVLGVDASEAIFVGDSIEEDVRGATSAGLEAVWLNPTGAEPAAGPMPATTIRELTEIEELVTTG
jgi:putative hydrolase of the HAD superfamily